MRVDPDPGLGAYRNLLDTRYRHDPTFVHPDVGMLSRLLTRKAAYLRHGRARAFAVRDRSGDRAFGVAFADPRLQRKVGRPVGSLGFLEWLDGEALGVLAGAAGGWLRGEGVSEVWAPFNGNPLYGMGLRADRFDEPPFLGCAHDPPGAADELSAAGFVPLTRYLDFEIDLRSDGWRTPPPDPPGVAFRPASRPRFRDEIRSFVRLHNAAFAEVWGEAEVSEDEGIELMGRARLAVAPSLFQFAVVDGRDAGFVLCMPDLNEALAPQRSPLTSPSGALKILRRRRRVRSVGLLALGVEPSLHGRGIGSALVARACRAAADLGYQRVEYALVAEENEASRSTAARFGGRQCRTFEIHSTTL